MSLSSQRKCMDTSVNITGKILTQFLLENEMLILNGRTPSDPYGAFTFLGHQGASTVDLCVCHKDTLHNLLDFGVHDVSGSDHLPISCTFKSNSLDNFTIHKHRLELKENSSDDDLIYNLNIDEQQFTDYVTSPQGNSFLKWLTNDSTIVETAMSGLNNMFQFFQTVKPSRKPKSNYTWYDSDCRHLQEKINNALHSLKHTVDYHSDYHKLEQLKSSFTELKRNKMEHFVERWTTSVQKARPNSRTFYNYFRQIQPDKYNHTIEMPLLDDLTEHFSHIFNPSNDKSPFNISSLYIEDRIRRPNSTVCTNSKSVSVRYLTLQALNNTTMGK
ncbi:hypothetical protein GQR58_004085 [Nymphon striatum]|nr:hypothetical protein GQR58_004085 [Nymphon striatum]